MTMKRDSPGPSMSEPPRKRPLSIDHWGRPRFKGCEAIKSYEMLGKLGEGTFGEVHKARNKVNGKFVALKKILMHNAKEEGFPITALREIKILKMLSHQNIIQLIEMAVERKKERVIAPRGTMYMITPYMEHDLAGLLENKDVEFSDSLVKCYLLQLLAGTKYLHENHILHRDMKAANLLIDNRGVLRIADFGLARIFDEPIPVIGQGGGHARRDYTNCVVTRWYRPPELLLGEKRYTSAIDLWGVGCVFAEMYRRKPILQGSNDVDQLFKIFHLCGSPTQKTMPGWDRLPGADIMKIPQYQRSLESQHSRMGSSGVALLSELLKLDPIKRINAIDALNHEYFRSDPKPMKPGEVPKFNDSHELDGKKNRHRGPPPAPAGGSVGVGQNAPEWAGRAGEVPWGGTGRRPDSWANSSVGTGGRQRPYERQSQDRETVREGRVPPGHRERESSDRRPPWVKSSILEQNLLRDPGLPPRPTGHADRERRLPARNTRGVGLNQDIDTYIPSYRGEDRPLDRSWDRDRGVSRERADWRDRDRDRGFSGGPRRSSSKDRDPIHNIYRR